MLTIIFVEKHTCLIFHLGKLGNLNQAEKIFQSMSKRNIVSYNILLNLYGLYCQPDKALHCYSQMIQQGHQADDKTHVALLHALSQTPKKINDVKRIFSSIGENKRGPMLTAAMIAALTRAQLFDDVHELLKRLPKENILFYAIKANTNEVVEKFDYPISITNEQLALYDLLMSNMYAYTGLSDRLTLVDKMLNENDQLKNILSYSWFENSNGKIEYFESTNSTLQNCEHTEKRALENALKGQTNSSLPIIIGKNHRMCNECHEYFKKLSFSTVSKKNIYLRDSTRFHSFSSGKCSCEVIS